MEGSVTDTSVTVMWRPGHRNITSQAFTIEYKKADSNEWHNVNISEEDETSDHTNYTLTKLSRGTKYEMRIYARNPIGKSDTSSLLVITTKGNYYEIVRFLMTT